MSAPTRFDPVDILTLRSLRTYIRESSARGGVVFFALLYGLGAAFSGGMILIASFAGGYTFTVLWSGGPGTSFWNYPGILFVAPWGVVSLPFFPTLAMVVSSVGVGYGMTVAFLLSVALIRNRGRGAARATATGTIAGLTPAMITLVTLGACCSTTLAASAGVGVVAIAAGTTTESLLVNNWFLGVFQIVIIWVALVAQELLLIVYSNLYGKGRAEAPAARAESPWDRRTVGSGALRVALLVGGLLWSLSMVAEWTSVSPASAGPGLWFQWVVEHQVVAFLAIAAALFPLGTWRVLNTSRQRAGLVLSGLLLVAGVLVLFSPPPLPSWGLDGLANQVLYVAGAPTNWGAVSTGSLSGFPLALRWGVEYLLLGGFAIAAALARAKTFTVLRWSVGGASVRTATPGASIEGADPPRTPATVDISVVESVSSSHAPARGGP